MKNNIFRLIKKTLLVLILLYSIVCNANKKNEIDLGVSNFVKWYSLKYNIRDSFVKDSNLFYKLSKKDVYYNHELKSYRVCLIHMFTSDFGEYWVSYYIPVYQAKNAKNYIYINIGGQDTVDVTEMHKIIKLIKNKTISPKGLGCKSKFYNRRKTLIEKILTYCKTTTYIL